MVEPKINWKKVGSQCAVCEKPQYTRDSWVNVRGTVMKRVCRNKDCEEFS